MQTAKRLGAWMRSTSSHQRPSQIALAVTCGILLGLLPKSSGLFFVFAALCYLLPAHLPLLAIVAIACSLLATQLVEPLGRIGLWSLTETSLAPFWLRMDGLPLVPWLGIHNSIIHGGMLVGLVASLPVFLISWMTVRLITNRVSEGSITTVGEQIADQAVEPVVAHGLEQAIALDVAAHQELRPLSAALEPGSVPQLVEPPNVVFSQTLPTSEFALARPKYLTDSEEEDSLTDQDPPSSEAILQRAIELAEWADELITAELNNDAASQPPAELQTALDSNAASSVDRELAEDQWLIETTMEVVRIAEQAVSQQAALKFKPMRDQPVATEFPVHPVHQPDAIERTDSQQPESPNMSSVQDAAIASSSLDRIHFHAGTHVAGDGVSPAISESMSRDNKIRRPQDAHTEVGSHLPATRSSSDQPREEALRYLLRHLKGIQDKVQKQ